MLADLPQQGARAAQWQAQERGAGILHVALTAAQTAGFCPVLPPPPYRLNLIRTRFHSVLTEGMFRQLRILEEL